MLLRCDPSFLRMSENKTDDDEEEEVLLMSSEGFSTECGCRRLPIPSMIASKFILGK